MNFLAKIDIERLIGFILAREKKDGGFAAIPSLPHTLQDTFQAVDTLDMVRRHSGRSHLLDTIRCRETGAYIQKALSTESTGSLKLRYLISKIVRLLKIDIDIDITITELDKTSRHDNDYEHEFYRTYFKLPPGKSGINGNRQSGGNHLTCRDLLFALKTNSGHRLPADGVSAPVPWLQRCQNGDGGFGFYPGTTSYIENCHYCLESLSILRKEPLYFQKAAHFIEWSQTASGGFSRSLKAAPFLDASWHAVKALTALHVRR